MSQEEIHYFGGESMFSAPMMVLLDTSFTVDHERLRQAVNDIHDKGFDAICLEFRNSIYNEYDPQGKAAMKVISDETQKLGMKFVQTMPMPGPNIVKQYPQARQVWAFEHRGHVINKQFAITVKQLLSAGFINTEPYFYKVFKVFRIERDRQTIVRAEDITDSISYSIEPNEVVVIKGTYEQDGEILVYAAYQTDHIDFAFTGIYQAVDEYIEQYAGLPLSGYAIDEFGTGSRVCDAYFIGAHFQKEFKEKYGYELSEKLYLLKNEAAGESAGKVRFDYYQLIMDHTYKIQKYVKDRYTSLYGKDLFGGFHSTWWGEGNSGDLWGGNIDYFRLTETLTGGFVDAQYDAERTMISLTMLAESLAKYSDSGIAYNMCWDRVITAGKQDYFQRFLAVRNVRWVGHAYGSVGRYRPRYPDHATWEDTKLCVHREKVFQKFIGKAVSKPKVAMLYIWESVARVNDDFMHYHKLSMKALLDKMMQRHIEIDIIPTFDQDLTRFDVLIVLWPAMMPESTWSAIKDYAASGKRLIFIGPPAQCTVDGRSIREEFESMTGAGAGELYSCKHYYGEYEYVAWDMWFTTDKIPMQCYPLEPADGDVSLVHEGDVLGVRKGNVEYYSFELPLTAYFNPILCDLEQYGELAIPEGIISKVSYDGDIAVITLTGQWGTKINASFVFRGNQITINNGNLVAIRLQENNVVEIISEKDAYIEMNGQSANYVIF